MEGINLENLNCPQYVRFSSESFQDSLNYDTSNSEDVTNPANQISLIEGDTTVSYVEGSSVQESEEEFLVHQRATRSLTSKLKKEVTVPKPFHFKTDNRLKNKESASTGNEEKDFASQLRRHEAPPSTTCGVTKVQPFNLTESKNKKGEGLYVPLAEQIKAFQKTPERYHSSAVKEFQPQEHWSPPKLRPRTPKLQAVKRHRIVNFLSREEQEEQELKKMKEFEFHALPVDPRVYKPDIIVKKKGRESIKSTSFDLKTAHRAVERPRIEEPHATYEFRARPVPKSILLGPTGLGEKLEVKTTQPISPAFCTRKRLEKRKLMEEQQDETVAKKGKFVPRPPIKPRLGKAKKTTPKPKFVRPVPTILKPFSFDKADKERYSSKEKKINEKIEKENKPFIFKAQLLPSPSASILPKVEKKLPTHPEPFNFVLDTRSLHHGASTSSKEISISFKAQPATVLKKEPFIPEKLQKHTTDFKEFDLNTDRRASERLKLQELKEAEEREKEQIRLARKALEEEKERQEILKLRQELVHKANPVRQYKVVEIKHSSKQLTEPISPQFETDKRLKVRNA